MDYGLFRRPRTWLLGSEEKLNELRLSTKGEKFSLKAGGITYQRWRYFTGPTSSFIGNTMGTQFCMTWLTSSITLSHAKSSLWADEISWHEGGESVIIFYLFISWQRSSAGSGGLPSPKSNVQVHCEKLHCRNHDNGVDLYSSTKEFPMKYHEKEEDVAYSSLRAAMVFWMG